MSVIDTHSNKRDGLKRRSIKRPVSPLQAQDAQASVAQLGDCVLTSRDYTLLEVWLTRSLESEQEIDPVLIGLVRAKLAAARIVLTGDVEADRAREGSRVTYTLDGLIPITQRLAHWRPEAITESILPITSLIGISLLGMKAPQRIPVVRHDGSLGGVSLEAVSPHPGGTRNNQEPSACHEADIPAENEPAGESPDAQEVPEKVLPFRPAARHGSKSCGRAWPGGSDDPDPGPAAA